MVKQRAVIFDDFSAGEFGALGSWNAPRGSFTGQNVMRYVDGSLGPRNGLKAYTLTSVPSSQVIAMKANAAFLWFQTAALNVYSFSNAASMASQAVTSLGAGVEGAASAVSVGDYVYYITSAHGIYKSDFVGAPTHVASSPNGGVLAKYGDRVVAGGDPANLNRLYYSAAADPTSWPAANYIDLGPGGDKITALVALRSALVIVTCRFDSAAALFDPTAGAAGQFRWWILTGVPGVNETLREVIQAQGPYLPTEFAAMQDGRVGFTASLSRVVGFFDGSRVDLVRHLPLGVKGASQYSSVVPMRDETDALFTVDDANATNTTYGYFRRNGAWLKQLFSEANVVDLIVPIESPTADLVVMVNEAAPATFYAWQPYNDRPPFSSDTYASVLTASDVYFTLPDIQAERGEQIAVRKVTVWFRDWDTGGSANQFAVNVTPIRQYESGDGTTQIGGGSSPSFTRSAGSSSTSGVNLRREWTFAEDYGDAARLKISDMRGVAIHRIEVLLDTKPELA